MWNTYSKSEKISKDGKSVVFNGRIKRVSFATMVKRNHLVRWAIPLFIFVLYHLLDLNVELKLNNAVRLTIKAIEVEYLVIFIFKLMSNLGYLVYQHFLPTMVLKDDSNNYFAVKERKSHKIYKAVDTRFTFWCFKGWYKLSAKTPSQNKAFKYLRLKDSEIDALKSGNVLVSKGVVPLFWNDKSNQFTFHRSNLTRFVGIVLCANNEIGDRVIDVNGALNSDLIDDLKNINTAVKDGVYEVYRMKFDKQLFGRFIKTNKVVSGQTVQSLLGNAAYAASNKVPRTVQPATVKIRAYRFNSYTWKNLVGSFFE